MNRLINDLENCIKQAYQRFSDITDAEASGSAAPGTWSRKEILGHLIDSASNNHQRFVRAQMTDHLMFPSYEQNDCVQIQNYKDESWIELVVFWRSYNNHLLHVLKNIPLEKLSTPCTIGDNQPIPLRTLIDEYVTHLKHHLEQI